MARAFNRDRRGWAALVSVLVRSDGPIVRLVRHVLEAVFPAVELSVSWRREPFYGCLPAG